jgi:hypothetical protein
MLERGYAPPFVIAETLDVALDTLHRKLLHDQCGML